MQKACAHCNISFKIDELDRQLLDKLSPYVGKKKFQLDDPKLCPDCRQQRRASFRNDHNYYKNNCHLCGTSVISVYSSDKNFQVLCDTCFWSDKWNPLSYGRDFDFSKPFFQQYAEMRANVPRLAIFNSQSENSKYTVHSMLNKNCYLSSSLRDSENVSYTDRLFVARDCQDILHGKNLELCYDCTLTEDSYNSDHLFLCFNLIDSYLCFDCRSGHNLIGCVGTRRKDNMILNQPATKQECLDTAQRLKTDENFHKEFVKKFDSLKFKYPRPCNWMFNSEDCDGNYLTNCKDVCKCVNIKGSVEGRYSYENIDDTEFMDIYRTGRSEQVYEMSGNNGMKSSAFCNVCYASYNLNYCDSCSNNCHNLFGCVSLSGKSFCILNKQYQEADYYQLLEKIIPHLQQTGEWGEFFPMKLSPYGYNETRAMEWFPLTKEEALGKGLNWSDFQEPLPEGIPLIKASSIPYDISKVNDEITKFAIECEITKRPFRILPQDLLFHRKKSLPLPRRSPKQRHLDRISKLLRNKTYPSFCDKCGEKLLSSYSPEEQVVVLCETCYLEDLN